MMRSKCFRVGRASASWPAPPPTGGMPPGLESGSHIMQDVGLVIHDQYPQPCGWGLGAEVCRRCFRAGGQGQLHREGRAAAFLSREHDSTTMLLDEALADREAQTRPL